jgi:hypothetical protein
MSSEHDDYKLYLQARLYSCSPLDGSETSLDLLHPTSKYDGLTCIDAEPAARSQRSTERDGDTGIQITTYDHYSQLLLVHIPHKIQQVSSSEGVVVLNLVAENITKQTIT